MGTITLDQLSQNVKTWSEQRLILEQSTCAKQIEKFYSERAEMITTSDLKDSYGDQMVCLINAYLLEDDGTLFKNIHFIDDSAMEMLGSVEFDLMRLHLNCAILTLGHEISKTFDPEECYAIAWNEIKKRAGLMVKGKFVKWDNLAHEQRVEVAKLGQLSHKDIDLKHCKSFCDEKQWLEIMCSIK